MLAGIGDGLARVPLGPALKRSYQRQDPTCSFPACGRPSWAKGLCGSHYGQTRTGKALSSLEKKQKGVCTFPGCGRRERCSGLCKTHNVQKYAGRELVAIGSSPGGRFFVGHGLSKQKFKPHKCRPHASIPDCFEVELTRGQVALVDAKHVGAVCEANTPGWIAQWDSCTEGFYAIRAVGRKRQTMHRFVADLEGFDPRKQVDHIHHNTLDNRASELREATRAQNHMNQRLRRDNRAGVKGVGLVRPGRYRAVIKAGGKNRHLGYFSTAEQAGAAYAEAARSVFGEFAHAEAIH